MSTAFDESRVASDETEAMPVDRWAAIAGRWSFEGGGATYLGASEESPKAPLYGLALNSVRLRDGYVAANVLLERTVKSTGGIVLGFQSLQRPYVVVAVGAFDSAYCILEYRPDSGWEPVARAGLVDNLKQDTWYHLEVELRGQRIRMSVDGIEVLETIVPRPLVGTSTGLFAWDNSPVQFQEVKIRRDRPRAFVIMPFAEPFDTLYREVIKPEAEELDFKIERVDEIHGPGIILDDIRRQIEMAHVVVAEISTPNPNVFYELGYAHALRKPAVLLVRREEGRAMPFDIRGYRAIFYDDTIGGKRNVQKALREHLGAILHDV
jgi:hypothetical protein